MLSVVAVILIIMLLLFGCSLLLVISLLLFQLLAGWLGQVLPYRAGVVILSAVTLAAFARFILLPARQNRPVYESERAA